MSITLKVLVVEDEPRVADFVTSALIEFGYTVSWCKTGHEGLSKMVDDEFDVAILDIMLPDIDGFQVLTWAREKGCRTPVLMLSARGSVDDRVQGLDLGADDYLAKPFELNELLARIRALLRRPQSDTSWLTVDDLTLEPLSRRVKRGQKSIDLTAREFSLLEFLLRNRGRVLSRAQIMDAVWGDPEADSNVIPVYINYLRSKIDTPGLKPLIHTARGVGYVLDLREKSPR